jgi:hypothetical protein
MELHYRYSSDNKTWSNWTKYEKSINSSPFEWNFTAKNGSGYYEFKTIFWDKGNQQQESEIKSINLTLFPTNLIIFLIIFFIIIISLSIIILKKLNKKN